MRKYRVGLVILYTKELKQEIAFACFMALGSKAVLVVDARGGAHVHSFEEPKESYSEDDIALFARGPGKDLGSSGGYKLGFLNEETDMPDQEKMLEYVNNYESKTS